MRTVTLVAIGVLAAAFGLGAGCSSGGATGSGGHGTSSASSSGTGGNAPAAGDSVLMHHKNPSRAGVYVQPSITKAAAKTMHLDPAFHAAVQGAVYAQPLFVDGGAGGKDVVIVATEENRIYALDAASGAAVWQVQVGAPVKLSDMPCGNIDPFGVTGTPVIDLASRTLFFDALTTPDGGATKKHLIFALSLDDGSVRSGWPVDMSTVTAGGTPFKAQYHGERGALALVNGVLYVPFGGLWGDCGDYHGWLVAVPIDNPAGVTAWATAAHAGGAWAPGGVASDGDHVYIATGNTMGANSWGGGEAILQFGTGSAFGGKYASYWAPTNWKALDNADVDIGGSGPVLFDVPGATPSKLTISLGKDGNAYLLDRTALGGVADPVAQAGVSSHDIINAAAAYTTSQGTYVVFKGGGTQCTAGGGDLAAIKIVAGSPPSIEGSWCASQNGLGSPMVTTTDGHSEAIVWGLGAEGDGKLHGFDGDTGEEIFDGGSDTMQGVKRFQTAIAAKGRIFVAGTGAVYAFTP
jgi:hypothetical protein